MLLARFLVYGDTDPLVLFDLELFRNPLLFCLALSLSLLSSFSSCTPLVSSLAAMTFDFSRLHFLDLSASLRA